MQHRYEEGISKENAMMCSSDHDPGGGNVLGSAAGRMFVRQYAVSL
jgi:hypothetical protein